MTDALDLLADALGDRYLIEEELGRGSSATVYRAQDLRHGRRVALKVLHSALGAALGVERFQREIRTHARLHHPHILPLFDSGTVGDRLFYTMPYVEAGSLRDRLHRRGGRLELEEVTRLAAEVASALGYAHAHGVIHRDLKPENIMISPTGEAILADFGIAYALESGADGQRGSGAGDRITETGVTVGTPAYMSPEQAAGEERLDGRSDQYALAAVVYESLTGEAPFAGPNARAILAHKLTSVPRRLREARPEIPQAVEQALSRALSRQADDRFESMEGFSRALSTRPAPAPRWLNHRRVVLIAGLLAIVGIGTLAGGLFRPSREVIGTGLATSEPDRVLVVLPFKNLGSPDDQYFADGLTEEITNRLAGLSGLRVISRTSADQYRGSTKSLKEIGSELGASHVLEGSVRWERSPAERPGRIRVTPQLIQVTDDSHLWADSYEEELTEVFRIQSEIAERVTAALDVALRAPERAALASVGTRNPEAYDFYLRGNEYAARSYGRSFIEASANLYQKALALDPDFALALARLSRAHSAMYWFNFDHTPARLDSAKRTVDAALRISPDLPEARAALGYYYYWGSRNYGSALDQFEAARRRQPSNSDILAAIGYVERRRGRWDRAIERLSEAVRYDPRSQLRTLDLADTYMSVRNYPQAERLFDRAIELAPELAEPYAYKAMLYLTWHGDLIRARAVIGQALNRVSAGRLAEALMIPDAISASLLTSDSVFAASVNAVRPSAFDGDTAKYHLLLAEAAQFRGDTAGERAHGDSARVRFERTVRSQPADAKLLARLGLAYARAGRKADAIRTGLRAAEMLPPSLDANSGPMVATRLALIYVVVDEPERAITTLAPLLSMPSWISPAELRSDPIWAPLRQHPRFAELLRSNH
jgi:serine/threonine protein kinase/Flp pilus assembly protein TadD